MGSADPDESGLPGVREPPLSKACGEPCPRVQRRTVEPSKGVPQIFFRPVLARPALSLSKGRGPGGWSKEFFSTLLEPAQLSGPSEPASCKDGLKGRRSLWRSSLSPEELVSEAAQQ